MRLVIEPSRAQAGVFASEYVSYIRCNIYVELQRPAISDYLVSLSVLHGDCMHAYLRT